MHEGGGATPLGGVGLVLPGLSMVGKQTKGGDVHGFLRLARMQPLWLLSCGRAWIERGSPRAEVS